jgi:hypothetical protein
VLVELELRVVGFHREVVVRGLIGEMMVCVLVRGLVGLVVVLLDVLRGPPGSRLRCACVLGARVDS